MNPRKNAILLAAAALITTAACPAALVAGQRARMNERGDVVMGFSHSATTHHFYLLPGGGEIQIAANSRSDTKSRDEIRAHLSHIARMFAEGDFEAPILIHAQVPPGVPSMKRLRRKITYRYEQTRAGGRVCISTADPQALSAIHEFLRFQIRQHRTGDSLEVSQRADCRLRPETR